MYFNQGFVGVDDIIVHDGSCSTTDLCDFESNLICNYENDPIASSKWKLGQGSMFNDINITDVQY